MAAADSCCDSPSTVILTSGGTDQQLSASGLQEQCSMSASCPCNMARRSVGFSLDVRPGRKSTELPWSFTLSELLSTSCHLCTLMGNLLPPLQSLNEVSPWTDSTEAPKSPPFSHNCAQYEGSVYRGRARGAATSASAPVSKINISNEKNWFSA